MRVIQMAKVAMIALALLIALPSCASSKPLSKDEAAARLRKLNPDIQVVSIGESPVKGLQEVVVQFKGTKKIVYIDEAGKNLVEGVIFNIDARMNLTDQRMQEIDKPREVKFEDIPLKNALVMGPKDAKYKVVVFDDPD